MKKVYILTFFWGDAVIVAESLAAAMVLFSQKHPELCTFKPKAIEMCPLDGFVRLHTKP